MAPFPPYNCLRVTELAIHHAFSSAIYSIQQSGSIPYADVFGETSGYATVTETLTYMESYSRQETLQHLADHNPHNWDKIQLPYYVFDGTVIEDKNLTNLYKLPGKTFSPIHSPIIIPQCIFPDGKIPYHNLFWDLQVCTPVHTM